MKVVHMTNTDPSFSPLEHSDQFRAQLENLEKLGHAQSGAPCDLTEFDEETERLLRQTFGNAHECVETYGLATTAEALVNLLKSSQEYLSHDFPQKRYSNADKCSMRRWRILNIWRKERPKRTQEIHDVCDAFCPMGYGVCCGTLPRGRDAIHRAICSTEIEIWFSLIMSGMMV
jgi:hypothetical protein